jgi:hypothetical protein
MIDRAKGCWVAFERDFTDEEAKPIIDAILQIRGVTAVDANILNIDDWMNRMQIRQEVRNKVLALYEKI